MLIKNVKFSNLSPELTLVSTWDTFQLREEVMQKKYTLAWKKKFFALLQDSGSIQEKKECEMGQNPPSLYEISDFHKFFFVNDPFPKQ